MPRHFETEDVFTYGPAGQIQEQGPAPQSSGGGRLNLLLEAERRGIGVSPQDQQLLAEARRRGMVPPPDVNLATPEAGPTDRSLVDRASIAAGGVNRGLFNVAGAIVDPLATAVTRTASIVPGVDIDDARPVARARDAAQEAGVFGVEPETRGERFASRAFEEVGAAAIPQAALSRTATMGGQLGQRVLSRPPTAETRRLPERAQETIQRLPENIARFLQEPFRQAPVRTNLMESATAGAAGLGAQTAREMGAEPYGGGELAGALAGGVLGGGVIGTGSAVGRGLGRAIGGRSTTSPAVRQEVGEALMDVMTDPTQADMNITRLGRVQDRVPGLEPTTAQAASDPGLAALEATRAQSGPRAGRFQQRRAEQEQAFERTLADEAPAGDPRATQQELARRRDQALGTAERQTGQRMEARDEALASAQPEQTPAQAGRTIREARTQELDAARAQEQRLWQQIEPERIDVAVEPIQARARDILQQTPRAQRETMPEIVRRVAEGDDALIREGDTLDELLGFRSRLRAEIDAERAGPSVDANRVRQLNQLADEVENTIQGAGARLRLSDPTVAERFQEASAFSRELNERLTRGPVGRVGQTQGRGGTPRVADSDVAREFFSGRRAGPERVRAFQAAFEDRPEAVRALRDAAMEDAGMRNIVREDGQINQAQLQRWVNNNEDLLRAYPEIDQDLGNVARAERFFRSARKRQEMLEKGLDNPRESTIARFLAPEEARDGMQQILRSQRPGEEAENLMRLVRHDDDAVHGARRAFFDLMMEGPTRTTGRGVRAPAEGFEATDTVLRYQRLRDFLNENDAVARRLFNDEPEHLRRLREISEDMQRMAATRPGAVAQARAGAEVSSVPGLTFAGLVSRGYAIARGVVSPMYIALETGGRVARRRVKFFRRNQVEQLLDDALLDPELARTLALDASDDARNVLRRRLRLHLINHIGVEDDEQTTTEDQVPPEALYIGPDNYRMPQTTGEETEAGADALLQ